MLSGVQVLHFNTPVLKYLADTVCGAQARKVLGLHCQELAAASITGRSLLVCLSSTHKFEITSDQI